jgi:hypothetical protein
MATRVVSFATCATPGDSPRVKYEGDRLHFAPKTAQNGVSPRRLSSGNRSAALQVRIARREILAVVVLFLQTLEFRSQRAVGQLGQRHSRRKTGQMHRGIAGLIEHVEREIQRRPHFGRFGASVIHGRLEALGWRRPCEGGTSASNFSFRRSLPRHMKTSDVSAEVALGNQFGPARWTA